jgi:hypothetical protein
MMEGRDRNALKRGRRASVFVSQLFFVFVLRMVRCCFVLPSVCVLIAILGFTVVWNKGRSSHGCSLSSQLIECIIYTTKKRQISAQKGIVCTY